MCNKKAQLGQKAKEANGREGRVEWGKEGISLKEIIEGWGQGASPFLNGSYPRAGLNLEVLGRGNEGKRRENKEKLTWGWGEWKDVAERWEEVGEDLVHQGHNVMSKPNQALSRSTFTTTAQNLYLQGI